MRYVRQPQLGLDLEAIKARLADASRRRACDSEAITDARVEIIGLLAEIDRLLWIERTHRWEFADLLAAARESLAATDSGESHALYGLRAEVNRHREIAAEELDDWRDWSDVLRAS